VALDCIVVGGGIGGAVLAAKLGRAGKRVIVLERSLAAPTWLRPEILWPKSVDVLRSLMPRERWLERCATPLRGIEFHDGTRLAPFLTESALSEPGVQPWSTHPHETRGQLLGLGDFELLRGVEVMKLLKDGERVIGVRTRHVITHEETEILGHLTIGDDGAQSVVRRACGLEMATRTFPLDFFCFGGRHPVSVPSGHARVWWNRQAHASGIVGLLLVPLPEGQCAALVPVISRTFDAHTPVEASWARFCTVDPAIGELLAGRRFPTDLMRVQRAWGHASSYGTCGAILIGDAAHPVSPAGGQGANMSIADAVVLSDLMLSGSTDLLRAYERLRRSSNARSIRPTRIAASVWSAPRVLSPVAWMPFIARQVGRCPSLQRRFMRANTIPYRGAPA